MKKCLVALTALVLVVGCADTATQQKKTEVKKSGPGGTTTTTATEKVEVKKTGDNKSP